MTVEEFRLFHDLIYKACGIYLKDNRQDFLETRLKKRLQARRIPSVYGYYKFINNGDEGRQELLALLDLLTINETYFFRNGPQLDLFDKRLLPDMISRRESEKQNALRIWSAGCSTGEEPHSIAMAVLDLIKYPRCWDIKIFASDLSLTVLQKAKEGIYPTSRLKEVSSERLEKYFDPCAEGYRVKPEVRQHVVFDFHNLKHDNGLQDLDAIFCRNVMIYFDEEEQKRLIQKFHRALRPNGYLLIGHAETLQGLSKDFRFIFHEKGTAYQKV